LERLTARWRDRWSAALAISDDQLSHALQELIAALDRRVPRVNAAGEAAIASDAAALRAKAIKRLADLHDPSLFKS
jgi:hypothetical protein